MAYMSTRRLTCLDSRLGFGRLLGLLVRLACPVCCCLQVKCSRTSCSGRRCLSTALLWFSCCLFEHKQLHSQCLLTRYCLGCGVLMWNCTALALSVTSPLGGQFDKSCTQHTATLKTCRAQAIRQLWLCNLGEVGCMTECRGSALTGGSTATATPSAAWAAVGSCAGIQRFLLVGIGWSSRPSW
jgi:hypothetical protein